MGSCNQALKLWLVQNPYSNVITVQAPHNQLKFPLVATVHSHGMQCSLIVFLQAKSLKKTAGSRRVQSDELVTYRFMQCSLNNSNQEQPELPSLSSRVMWHYAFGPHCIAMEISAPVIVVDLSAFYVV